MQPTPPPPPPRAQLVRQELRKFPGVDPAAALAVAAQEGLGGGVGDNGSSFGPFQLHKGGALPQGVANPAAWAWSPQGIDFALSRIANVSRGQHGSQAVRSIVSQFERPANPAGEIAGALRAYSPGGATSVGAGAPMSAGPAAPAADPAARKEAILSLISSVGQSDGAGIPAFLSALQTFKASTAPQAPALAPHAGAAPSLAAAAGGHTPLGGVVKTARSYLGTPYQFGGDSHAGIDCSALLQQAWASAGVKIPRTTYDQWQTGTAVSKAQLRPGDAVFFKGSDAHGNLPGHVGIYIGGGKMIEAAHTGTNVRVSSIDRPDFVGARTYRGSR